MGATINAFSISLPRVGHKKTRPALGSEMQPLCGCLTDFCLLSPQWFLWQKRNNPTIFSAGQAPLSRQGRTVLGRKVLYIEITKWKQHSVRGIANG